MPNALPSNSIEITSACPYRGVAVQPHTQKFRHSRRRGFAGKVLAATGDMNTVAVLLGHSSIDCSQRYVDVDPATLRAMFCDAISDQSFSCADTQSFFETGKNAKFASIKSTAERKLAQLDAAPSLNFMRVPPGNDLKEYDGAWHVRINNQWRLTFKWGDAGPYDVLIEDPH